MTSMLPPTRDLPPGRHTQIRAELERAAGGRGRSRLTVPILAAAAAVFSVAAGVVLLRPAPSDPTPLVQITSPAPTSAPVDFGVPPETVAAITEGCAKAGGVATATLRQLVLDEPRWALLYTDGDALSCHIGEGRDGYSVFAMRGDTRWLAGHFSVDEMSSAAGGDAPGVQRGEAGKRGFHQVGGRVSERVARVTLSADNLVVDAKVVNGTYAARIYYPSTWRFPENGPSPVVRVYDAAGNLLGSSDTSWQTCYQNPQTGELVGSVRQQPTDQCQPATPWK
ncbi:hypothetical protein UK23_38440 [Lentzea aerocolonigenes]|uniref:Uncharacterized protein n=1 Tax=Lentzea aerocolonigenes TaxID=68170 RepID=A0A0F0GJS9_LENAE|nr:hypothetical protein [Lentzea aerocolonigenes]KJK42177.1 hypothetical protein UK23_38440 [Lentzea aerocolonigenes]